MLAILLCLSPSAIAQKSAKLVSPTAAHKEVQKIIMAGRQDFTVRVLFYISRNRKVKNIVGTHFRGFRITFFDEKYKFEKRGYPVVNLSRQEIESYLNGRGAKAGRK